MIVSDNFMTGWADEVKIMEHIPEEREERKNMLQEVTQSHRAQA